MSEFDIRMPTGERDTAIPEFYMRAVENKFRTRKEGRPIFDDIEYVRIILPGNRRDTPEERVTQTHRDRWPTQYARFKAGQEAVESGTPLEQWAYLSRSQVEELRHFHIRTVEALAGASDTALQSFAGGIRLRDAALAYLKQGEDMAPISALQEQLRQKDLEIDRLNHQISDLVKRMETKNAA